MDIQNEIYLYNAEVDTLIEQLSQIKITDDKFNTLLDVRSKLHDIHKKLNKRTIEKSFYEIYDAVARENFMYRVRHDPNYITITER